MKLNNKFKNNATVLVLIIIACLYHGIIQNGLEKIFNECFLNYDSIKRPLSKCNKDLISYPTSCDGMPSGHAETITIFSILLYLYKFIPLWFCILMIILVSLQRLVTNVHSIIQVAMGIFAGLIYSSIYKYFDLSIISFLIIFTFGFILSLLCVYKLDKKICGPIPKWVDSKMIPSIKKKQMSPLYTKIGSIYINAVIQSRLFISWTQLEKYLDIIVDKIKNSGQRYDAVVGIKTGGAIISDYVSNKLNLPNYKVKISRSEYNCNKKPHNAINDIVQKNVFNNLGEFTVCEEIEANLEGKNIILIDELVSTGKTITEAYNYLKTKKNVNDIYLTSVTMYKNKYSGNLFINYIMSGTILIWPWGYDN